jgi:hypothetical protein
MNLEFRHLVYLVVNYTLNPPLQRVVLVYTVTLHRPCCTLDSMLL